MTPASLMVCPAFAVPLPRTNIAAGTATNNCQRSMTPSYAPKPLPQSQYTTFTRYPIYKVPKLDPQQTNVRFGSLADITARLCHVRFTPDNGHSSARVGCPKSANRHSRALVAGALCLVIQPLV